MRIVILTLAVSALMLAAGAIYGIDSPIQGAFDYTVGFDSRPRVIMTADFDKNGAPDLITMNGLDGTVSVFLNGLDWFSPDPVITDVGIQPGSLLLSDFNNDGDVDILVLNYETDSVFARILTGDGTGSFTTDGIYHVGARDWGIGGVTVADYTGDGYDDIAVAWWASNVIALYLNDGTGHFLDPVYIWSGDILSTEEGYGGICSFDADGDGDIDLAGIMDDSQLVAVYYNPGDGGLTYENRATFPVGRQCWELYPADFDGDGDVDLACGGLVIMSNDGGGTFAATFEMDAYANTLFPVDIDDDGDFDLIGTASVDHTLMILKNGGTGIFYHTDSYNMYGDLPSVCAADFDADGDHDVAVARVNSYQTAYFSVLYNPGNGYFPGSSDYYVSPDATPGDVVVADLDGDGDNDVISTAPSINVEDYMLVLVNDGYGSLDDPVGYLVGDYPRSLVAADLDGDGDIDVATGNTWSDDISVLLNNGDATYQDAVTCPAGGEEPWLASADVDNDSDIDLISANYRTGDVSLLLNNSDATFATPVVVPIGTGLAYRVVAADLDGDDDADLAILCRDPYTLAIMLNDGAAGFTEFDTYGAWGGCLDAKDLDADGDVDLALTRRDDNAVSVFLNNGDATFALGAEYPVGDAPFGIVAADLNNDAVPDLVVVNDDTHNMSLLLGQGGGAFDAAVTIAVGYGPGDVTAGDLDSDGDLDVVVTNHLNHDNDFIGSLSVFFNHTNAAFVCGDANGDAVVNVADAVYVVSFVFKNGPPPSIFAAADCNADSAINVADAVYTVNFIFKSGPMPACQ